MDPTVLMEETVTMPKALRLLQLFPVLLDHKGKQVPRVQMAQTVELDLQVQQVLLVQLEVVQLAHKVQRVRMEVMDHPVQRDSREHVERREQSDLQKLRWAHSHFQIFLDQLERVALRL
jgi:hypothetical protein